METICELFELKEWWFKNSNVWFDSDESYDILIANKYEYLINIDFEIDFIIGNKELGIGYIILLDQISRHIMRAKKYSLDFVEKNLNKIIKFVESFYSKYKNDLEGYEFCFVLLPFRHSNIFKYQKNVMIETWEKISNTINPELIKIYKNYLEATYKRSTKGETYLSGNKFRFNCDSEILQFIVEYRDILDSNCNNYNNQNNDINSNVISKIMKTCEELKKNKKKYILSISGGVDSMVLSYVLVKNCIDFVMLHINYFNRGEVCEKEKDLILNWSNYIGIDLYIRDIYEINRPKCMEFELRNLYENYTRNVRFQSYIDVAQMSGWDNKQWSVLMGHNNDDCIENILTNIANKTKYDNLMGMDFESDILFGDLKINFTRPFLKIAKLDVYNFAHEIKIPYLLDSTPKWSQRGMIRDIVRPALIRWNNYILEGFEELVDIMKESLDCVDLLVSNWIEKLQSFDSLDMKEKTCISSLSSSSEQIKYDVIKLNISEIKTTKLFWSRLLVRINIPISSKTLTELINRLECIKNKFNSIQIKQQIQIQINKNNKLYFWKINDNKIIIGFN